MTKRPSPPMHSKIANYWKGKFITKEFRVADKYSEDSIRVIEDFGEPSCMCCGFFNENIYDDPKFDYLFENGKHDRLWNLRSSKAILQRAHIVPHMLAEGNSGVDNYFLLCKRCHQESPDYADSKYFFAYIYNMRKRDLLGERIKRINKEMYIMAKSMNKNILSIEKKFKNNNYKLDLNIMNLESAGLHGAWQSEYTMIALMVDSMDDLDRINISDEEIKEIRKRYNALGLDWD